MDTLSDARDIDSLLGALAPEVIQFSHVEARYEHLDFTWGKDAHIRIYPKILELVNRFAAQSTVGKSASGSVA